MTAGTNQQTQEEYADKLTDIADTLRSTNPALASRLYQALSQIKFAQQGHCAIQAAFAPSTVSAPQIEQVRSRLQALIDTSQFAATTIPYANIKRWIAEASLVLGDDQPVRELLRIADNIYAQNHDKYGQGVVMRVKAVLTVIEGDLASALDKFHASQSMIDSISRTPSSATELSDLMRGIPAFSSALPLFS